MAGRDNNDKKWFIDYLIKDTLSIVDELLMTHKTLQLKSK
jgi:hypothetical protein